jgi:hypothetical protein
MELMEKARIVAQRIAINPPTPKVDSISEQDFETIFLLFKVIMEGEHRQSGNGARFSGRLIPSDLGFGRVGKRGAKMGIIPVG